MHETKEMKMVKTALVVGASGIVGNATAALLVEHGWKVYGLARRPIEQDGVIRDCQEFRVWAGG